MLKKVLNNVC